VRRRTQSVAVAAAAALALAGCGSTVRRTVALVDRGVGAATEPASSFAALQSGASRRTPDLPEHALTLEEAVDLALERNPDLRAAAARIAEAEAKLGEATAPFYPQVGARLGYARTDSPAQAFMMILNQRVFSFDLDFNHPGVTQNVRPEVFGAVALYRGGRDYERREANALGVETARLQQQAIRNALTEAVIAGYYALIAAPEQVRATEASLGAIDSALAQARARLEAGSALKSDVLSLEVRQAEAREANLRAANAVELSRTGLRTLLALPAGSDVTVAPLADETAGVLPADLGQALAQASEQRPELAAAARAVEMRQHEVDAEWAGYLPRIDAVGNFGNDSSDFQLTDAQNNWLFGVAAEIDLFSGFQTRERVRAAEQRLNEAREAERNARLEVEREVQTAFLAWQETSQRTVVAEAAVASAEDALRLVDVQYAAGSATITRYLEAEAAAAAARSRAIAARYELRRAEASLQKAMGTWAKNEAGES